MQQNFKILSFDGNIAITVDPLINEPYLNV